MATPIQTLLQRRRSRAIKQILDLVDQVDNVELHRQLRKMVLDEVNDFGELAIGLVDSVSCDHVAMNEHYLQVLDEMHDVLLKVN